MKKIFIMFAIGWQFASGAMDLEDSYAGIVIESLVYSKGFECHAGEISCYSPVIREYGMHNREFTPILFPRSSIVRNGVRFLVTSMENPIVDEVSPTPPMDPEDDVIRFYLEECDDTLRFVCIPASVRVVSEFCFFRCNGLTEVVFEYNSQLRYVRRNAFESCLSLRSMNIPKSVQVLGARCFAFCKGLGSLTFEPEAGLEWIEEMAFHDCLSLRLIILPNGTNVFQEYSWEKPSWDFGSYQGISVYPNWEDFGDADLNSLAETYETPLNLSMETRETPSLFSIACEDSSDADLNSLAETRETPSLFSIVWEDS
ncbi:MAG: leucine-rich repeat domain-containing protein [Holosporaceae bacterium]|jgi:hypothetical protein|nr:leucine-rich repeat domain-containing protein [Holosporaceae bacterium]